MNRDGAPVPAVQSRLHDHLQYWARVRPQVEAVVSPARRLTYRTLVDAVDACAAAMIAAGVGPGDRVATLATPGPDFLVTFLATAAIGGIWVGLNPRYAEPELESIINRIAPKLVFSAGVIEERTYHEWMTTLPAGIRVVCFDEPIRHAERPMSYPAFEAQQAHVARMSLEQRYARTRPADPCLIVFTSGSTGTPKGAMISHAALVGASKVQLETWPVEPLKVLNNLPINHIGCVGDLSCYALIGGGTVVFTPRFDPVASLAAISDERITVWGQVPTMFQLTLDAVDFDPAQTASLQLAFWGGAHATPELVARLHRLVPRVATSYGQTETVGSVTFTRSDATLAMLARTVGGVANPYRIRIVDADGLPVAQGESGEIQVHTPFGMSGYWNDPEATAQSLTVDGWRLTGDIGAITADGDLQLLGRVHDVFKSGGYNIYPAEIEEALAGHPAVDQASVVGIPDALYGTVAVAFVVARGRLPPVDTLRSYLQGRLANYKVPKRIVPVSELPHLAVGKVDKRKLREQAETG